MKFSMLSSLAALTALGSTLFFVAPVRAEVKTQMIEYTYAGATFQGFIAYDDATAGKKPGVLVCHEWWGNNDNTHDKCKMLAKEGYIAFALDMYGKGQVTTDPKQAGEWSAKLSSDPKTLRERAVAGLKVLAEHAACDATKIAVIGYCMGGSVALELARTGADVKAVVCFHTSNLSAKNAADNKAIKARVLVCSGADDEFIKPEEKANFMKQMKEAGIDYQFIEYGGAVHSFTNPKADSFKIPSVAYNEKADKRSWAAMKALFAEVL